MTDRHEGVMVGGGEAILAIAYSSPSKAGTDASSPTSERRITMQPHTETAPPDHFPTETAGLPSATIAEHHESGMRSSFDVTP
jgi:hypothetical protein